MAGPYRSELEALRGEVEALREDLARSEAGAAELSAHRAELARRLAALEGARLREAEKIAAVQRVRWRTATWGIAMGLAIAFGVGAAFERAGPAERARVLEPDAWFEHIRPHCNAVEVQTAVHASPPPSGPRGRGYLATCYAIAGRTDAAREVIDGLQPEQRRATAALLFGIAHPIADSGDDLAAGPAMEIVLEHSPDNFMAAYHAGMSAYAAGDAERARARLTRFLALYPNPDGWRRNAQRVIEGIDTGEHVELEPDPYADEAPWRP